MLRHRALNCWMEPEPRHGVRQGHIIRYNLIAGSRERGIYLDNYTSNCHVYGNIVVGAASDGIYIHGGRNNLIENNIIADCHRALMAANYIDRWMPAMAGFLSGNRFAHNIVYGGYEALAVHGVPAARAFSQADENVFYKVLGAEPYLGASGQSAWNGIRKSSIRSSSIRPRGISAFGPIHPR